MAETRIHSSAVVEEGARIGAGVRIGPFCHVGPEVALGEGCELVSHVVLAGKTTVGPRTRIEVVTEGILARRLQDDPVLDGVGLVIFDEFHERSLDADMGLALARDAQTGLREDLRIVIMSATLDGGRVARLLDDAPVIESAGRTYPVDIHYRPRKPDQRVEDAVADAVRAALREEEGSILAFLPGQAEIRRTAERLEPHLPSDAYLASLFGAMDIADQDRAILPAEQGRRKIVLATAIAESSVTIDGVRIVIDSGLSRQPAFEPGQAITRLETVRESRASADQRAGRAGRTQPGIVIRLWHEGQTAALVPFDPPEITRTDLTRLMLDCLAWGVADPHALRFLDPPPEAALSEARSRLVPSLTTPLALLTHAAAAERSWFQRRLAALPESEWDGYGYGDDASFAAHAGISVARLSISSANSSRKTSWRTSSLWARSTTICRISANRREDQAS